MIQPSDSVQKKSTPANLPRQLISTVTSTGKESLTFEQSLEVYRDMVRSRKMEERMIKMSKSGEGYFWIGGPGEEAFQVALGKQVKRGCGPEYDFLHLHYRDSATMIALGMPMIDGIRQMAMTATDPNSMGRNFVGHYARKEWNVVPVTSVIEIQYTMAPGTAMMQNRIPDNDAITIVVGGDAGTAEGDFASCLIWSSLPEREVPVLIVVTNNQWGISTPAKSQHAEQQIIDRGKAFGIPGEVVDGNDPVASWHAVDRAMTYCRTERKPFLLEANVSRLHGHSSSSGAIRVESEIDCIAKFEEKLLTAGAIDASGIATIHQDAEAEAEEALHQALNEPKPTPDDIFRYTFAPSDVDQVYPDDYTGLPT